MRAGEFPNGARVLRAKLDMASPNINLRDPVLYRIVHAAHPRTGDAWSIYPTYDFAHGQSDAIEGVTHSICTLEFEAHRPLYDWLIENLPGPVAAAAVRVRAAQPHVHGAVEARPARDSSARASCAAGTTRGCRRSRGCAGAASRPRASATSRPRSASSKADSVHEIGLLEHAVRNVLNRTAPRRFAVLDPVKVVIENYPDGQVEEMDVVNNPEDPSAGTRKVAFGRELWIERDDFMEEPPPKFFRLSPGREVRLRSAYFVTCTRGREGRGGRDRRAALHVRPRDPRRRFAGRPTAQGDAPLGVGGARRARPRCGCTTTCSRGRIPGADGDLFADLNPASETVVQGALVEPSLADAATGETVQFERLGYFTPDPDSSAAASPSSTGR